MLKTSGSTPTHIFEVFHFYNASNDMYCVFLHIKLGKQINVSRITRLTDIQQRPTCGLNVYAQMKYENEQNTLGAR